MMKAESLMWSLLLIAPISARPVACCSINELQKSPQGLMKALSDLLEFAIELDTGKYSQGTAPVILYVIRIITRVESFIHVVPDEISQLGPNTNEWCWLGCILSRSRVFPSTNQIKLMTKKRKHLRTIINEQVYPVLECWCQATTKRGDIRAVYEFLEISRTPGYFHGNVGLFANKRRFQKQPTCSRTP
jgi:hypothetical protein